MSCAEFEDLILDRIDGALRPALVVHLENHLAACEHCQAFLTAVTETDQSIAQFAKHPGLAPHFTSGVLRKLDRAKPWFPGIVWDFAGVGAVAAAGAFCAWHLVPNVMLGAGWLAATVIACGGMCIAVADSES
jgi:anti-sigma factor RsiW